ncbi:hypothetical protein SCUCBS95973_008670 [Sporothrix curviconia]|uniref:Cytochrome b561 domain-containing protein n=1 Tax=Sporothrix curviconia TaxID=1260050 RepID=A0ABP0CNV9_9PEZI
MSLSTWARWALVTSLATGVLAADLTGSDDLQRYGPFGSNGPFGGGGGSSSNGGVAGSRNGNGFPGLFGINLRDAIHYRTIHGILASLSIVVLFPVGSILMRIVPGRFAIWAHALFQLMAFILYIAAAALGIYLVKMVTFPFGGGNLLSNPSTNIHPIMGIVTLATLFFQPVLGFIHHARFKQLGRRTFWSYMHLWNGRIGITVGIVNGGLGLRLANAPYSIKVAYIIVAVVVWFFWFVVAVISEVRRVRQPKTGAVPAVAGGGRMPYGRGSRAVGNDNVDGTGAFYAARVPGSRGTRLGRSPGPEMTATRNVSASATGAGAGAGAGDGTGTGAVPDNTRRQSQSLPRSGQNSPKVRESHSSSDGSEGPIIRH